MKKALLLALSVFALSGCYQNAQIDQSKLCIASTDEEAKKCTAGELILFKPSHWGNEQLPLNIAAAYCDFNHQVIYNNSGLICTYTDKRLSLVN